MLSNFGQVTPLVISNQLVLLDKAGNLSRIMDIISSVDRSDRVADHYSHECKYVKARDAERILRDLLGDPLPTVAPMPSAPTTPGATPAAAATDPRGRGRGDSPFPNPFGGP